MEAKIQILNVFLSQGEWYGIPRGYNISYRIVNSGLRGHRGRGGRDSARMSTQQPPSTQLHSISIEDPTKNSFVLDGLEEFTQYEVLLQVSWEKLVIISSNLAFTSHLLRSTRNKSSVLHILRKHHLKKFFQMKCHCFYHIFQVRNE